MLRKGSMKYFFFIFLIGSSVIGKSYLLNFNKLNEEQKNIHAILCKTATQAAYKKSDKRNYFLPALSFIFKEKRITYVLAQENNEKQVTCFISKDKNPRLNLIKAHNNLCNSTSFFKLPFVFCNENLKTLNTYLNRLGEEIRYRLIDSEMLFIGNINFIKRGINLWINVLIKSLLEENRKEKLFPLQAMELHGFTTRDMCPCCFQHMSDFLEQANEKQSERTNFFGALIKKLKDIGINCTEGNIPVTFYISSLVKLGRMEFDCSRYVTYANRCSEAERVNILTEKNVEKKNLYCIFLRNSETDKLSTETMSGQKNLDVIVNANSLNQEFLDKDFNTSVQAQQAKILIAPVTKI